MSISPPVHQSGDPAEGEDEAEATRQETDEGDKGEDRYVPPMSPVTVGSASPLRRKQKKKKKKKKGSTDETARPILRRNAARARATE